jgi:hypothetical protein
MLLHSVAMVWWLHNEDDEDVKVTDEHHTSVSVHCDGAGDSSLFIGCPETKLCAIAHPLAKG